ncbi:hypothetical protein A3197_21030 [Candidatus Thiodiazotropha endoloripes]|nr:hypothetical protein A3197_21030 [Candidatus Thiodiazotropha endoloripes]
MIQMHLPYRANTNLEIKFLNAMKLLICLKIQGPIGLVLTGPSLLDKKSEQMLWRCKQQISLHNTANFRAVDCITGATEKLFWSTGFSSTKSA